MKTSRIILRNTLYLILILILCVGCADSPSLVEQIGKDVRDIQNDFEKGYVQTKETGKSIGRNAMLIYLQETNQIDSITIDLHRLMIIEDSLDMNN